MILEWILEENTGTLDHQWSYSHKNSEVNKMFHTRNLQLPPPLMRDSDIFERFLRLYGGLVESPRSRPQRPVRGEQRRIQRRR